MCPIIAERLHFFAGADSYADGSQFIANRHICDQQRMADAGPGVWHVESYSLALMDGVLLDPTLLQIRGLQTLRFAHSL